MTFESWWNALPCSERPFGTAAKIIAAKAWNAGVHAACDYVCEIDVTAYEACEELTVLEVDGYRL